MPTLSPASKALIARPVLATLATVSNDGTPQVTPLWIEADGDDLLVNTAQGRVKANNMERNPHVAITVIDPDNPYNVVAAKGQVVEMTAEGADEHIDRLAQKYMGVEKYPMRQPGEVRLTIRIRIDRLVMEPQAG